MKYEFHDRKLKSTFGFSDHLQQDEPFFTIKEGVNKIIWNRNQAPVTVLVDGVKVTIQPSQIITTTFYQKVTYLQSSLPLSSFWFNKAFYCLINHDSEVSCNGILFFGTQDLPIISIPKDQCRKFDILLEVMIEEFKTKDNIQGDMLQMLLKRLIIICTRLAKKQLIMKTLNDGQIETIRQFNFLVDVHFKTKRKVKDYAELLHKSAKTLSNLFSTYNQKTPQLIIQERVVLEAKRLLMFTKMQTQEIAFELGFEDPAYFSRYFKKIARVTPSKYRESTLLKV